MVDGFERGFSLSFFFIMDENETINVLKVYWLIYELECPQWVWRLTYCFPTSHMIMMKEICGKVFSEREESKTSLFQRDQTFWVCKVSRGS